MTAATGSNRSVSAAAHELRAAIEGNVVLAGEDAYPHVREIWNGAVDHQPVLFALCETVADVQAAVRVARAHEIPLSVRGGGHDWAGRALRHNGLVIDLTRMRHVEVDTDERTATVAGGATGSDVSAATTPHGLAAVTGNVGAVGMAGFLLAGGYGPLTTRFGLAIDNLLGAELVLADGRVMWVDESHNSDLFWGIRGGGGNFGVVTSMRIRLHPIDVILAGVILFPWSDARVVLRGYADIMASAPDELSMLAGAFPGPEDNPGVFLGPVWSGDLDEGEKVITCMKSLGTPVLSQVVPMSFADVLRIYDAQVVNGRHYALQTRWLADLTPPIVSAVVNAGATRTSPLSFIVLHHFHGASTRIAPAATAFAMRQQHFMIEMVSSWEPGSNTEPAAHRQWVSDFSSTLGPYALPGGYANFLTQDAHDQIGLAYGDNARRLVDLKQRFDRDNVFSSATPLPA